MSHTPGSSYDIPLTTDASPHRPKRSPSQITSLSARKVPGSLQRAASAPMVVIPPLSDSESEDDRKMPALSDADCATRVQGRRPTSVIWFDSDSESEDDRKMPPLRDEDISIAQATTTIGATCAKAPPPQKVLSEHDEALAMKIQIQEWEQHEMSVRQAHERKQLERVSMKSTLDGQAWLFIEQVIDLQKKLLTQYPGLQTVAVDDMVLLAKQFIQCQQEFRQNGIDATVTLAYHYTKEQNMDSIQQDGLMTVADRDRNGIRTRQKGAYYGDGVYTATNPYAFQNFGNVGLLVAVLLGRTGRVSPGCDCPFAKRQFVNTTIGNKSVRNIWEQISDDTKLYDELVLKESKQCLPLFRYDVTLVSCTWQGKVGADAIWSHQVELQKLLDRSFNSGVVTKLERIMPSTGRHYVPPVTSVTPTMSNAAASANTGAQRTAAPLPVAALPTHQPPNSWFQPGAFPTNSSASANVLFQQPSAPLAMTNVSIYNTPPSVLALQAPPAPRPFRPHSPIFGGTSSQVASFPTAPPVFGGISSQVASFPTSRQTFRTPPFVAAAPPRQSISHEVLMYEAPATLTTSTPSDAFEACATSPGCDDECPICMEALNTSGQLVKITACGHKYHLECIKAALTVGSKCPICRKSIKNPQGHSPSGTMTITSTTSFSRRCSGFEDHWTIVIEYVIPSGYQMAYHPSPGHPFRGGIRKAYLPNNEDGRKLLERLKLAWMLGLTFTIGTSLTSGKSNVVTWASIHHKTSTFGGSHAHGFPDPAYFSNCNEELDSLGVPKPVQV